MLAENFNCACNFFVLRVDGAINEEEILPRLAFARKGVSPEYLHKSGQGLGFCPVEAIAD
jgi:hypothetical protein